ncbi:MAG: iron-containing alcohol dehydrogenase [Acidobacteriota bacterium]
MLGFRLPTHVHLASGAVDRLPEALASLDGASADAPIRALLVTDAGLRATPLVDRVLTRLAEAPACGAVTVFDAVEANPRTTTAEAAAVVARADDCGAVIALGGGSVLDAAKGAALLARNDGDAADYVDRRTFDRAPLPLIAVPTTCGTGSEVTWVSVLTEPDADRNDRTGRKISVKGQALFPAHALVDPDLLITLPPRLIATTGLDALTHALEAITGRRANPVSDALAAQAIALLFDHLPRAVRDIANDAEARFQTMRASTLAGIAFGNADVAGVHCLSEALGGRFDVPHGLANALLLRPILAHHRPTIDPVLAHLADTLLPEVTIAEPPLDEREQADAFFGFLDAFLNSFRLPKLGELGVPSEAFDEIAALAEANGSNPSNPTPMRAADYRAVLDALTA